MRRYGLTESQAEARLERQQARDQIKNDECALRGITLIRLKLEDLDFKDFQDFITSEYERLTGVPAPKKAPFDYRIAMRIIKGRFLKLDFYL